MNALVAQANPPGSTEVGTRHQTWECFTEVGTVELLEDRQSPQAEKRGEGSEVREAEKIGPNAGGRTELQVGERELGR